MRRKLILVLLVACVAGLAVDYLRTPDRDLRGFDPNEVARIETDMWRSYYDRHRMALFTQLCQVLRRQYRLSPTQSVVTAFHAARAAVRFQDGSNRAEYQRALPDLIEYYAAILGPSRDASKAARLELEWWIIHRERHSQPPQALPQSLAALQAEIYQLPAERFAEHGRLRAEAMLLRDREAEAGTLRDEGWMRIGSLLNVSWVSLRSAVR